MKNKKAVLVLFLISLAFLAGILVGRSRGIPFMEKRESWAIGIYTGDSPFNLSQPEKLKNPVLSYKEVTDVKAASLADPFMVKENNRWYLFFEVENLESKKGEIGLAESADGFNWAYRQIVLKEPFHLSFPYVFKWEGEYYLIPESYQDKSVRLYKALEFPARWSYVTTLLSGENFMDSAVVRYRDKWWLFTSTGKDNLYLYYADQLLGPWQPHPQNPVKKGEPHFARMGGRLLLYQDQLFRFVQDCAPVYGKQVFAFKITELSPTSFKEELFLPQPVLKPAAKGWKVEKMHNIDPHQLGENQWIACVDGNGLYWFFSLKY